MNARLDHVVLWVEDPLRSVEFFEKVVGLWGVRVDEFRGVTAPFPSVRVSDETIIDLMPRAAAPMVNAMVGSAGSAGNIVNHICLSMSEADFIALQQRLEDRRSPPAKWMERSFGARGAAPKAFYFKDPDGNVFEARYY